MSSGIQLAEGTTVHGEDYALAFLNILEDFAADQANLKNTQAALLNIVEDIGSEKVRLAEMQSAVINILDDLAVERTRVAASLTEKEMLLKEVHHRVKNNLQLVSSLLTLQSRFLTDPHAAAIFRNSHDRVMSMALIHEKLYLGEDFLRIDFAEYVGELVRHLAETWGDAAARVAIRWDLGRVLLPSDIAIPCGLILNELVTNAVKHAFPSGRRGSISIRLRKNDTEGVSMRVLDDGVGLSDAIDVGRANTLGLQLVATLARQIGAEMRVVREGGTLFEISFRIKE